MVTITKSRIFHPFRRYASWWQTKPNAMIFITDSIVKMARNRYSTFSWQNKFWLNFGNVRCSENTETQIFRKRAAEGFFNQQKQPQNSCRIALLVTVVKKRLVSVPDVVFDIVRATMPSLFLRFFLTLQYHVLENVNVLISKKCPYLWLASLFFIFCSITISNKQYVIGIQTISITFCNLIFFVSWKYSIILQHRRNALSSNVSTVSCLLWLGFLGKLVLWWRFSISIDWRNKQA